MHEVDVPVPHTDDNGGPVVNLVVRAHSVGKHHSLHRGPGPGVDE